MKLYAISDLHVDFAVNRRELKSIPDMTDHWLITGGDICTSLDHLRETWDVLVPKFNRLFWVPGNHELWSSEIDVDGRKTKLKGQEKYMALVDLCREYGVLTPEDPYISWPETNQKLVIAPLFIPYDYSFRPADVPEAEAISWAMASGVLCADEKRIDPSPYPSMIAWCSARYQETVKRLEQVEQVDQFVLINHFPLRQDLVRLRRIPRFTIWCGTKRTHDLHQRFPTKVAVSGHLHMRATDYRDGVRFEEVSLGYPKDWDQGKGPAYYFREILPGPPSHHLKDDGPIWRFF